LFFKKEPVQKTAKRLCISLAQRTELVRSDLREVILVSIPNYPGLKRVRKRLEPLIDLLQFADSYIAGAYIVGGQ
jgi:hypothetical protein